MAIISGGSGGGAPSGAAGGDLAGTYPNPSIGLTKVTSGKIAAGAAATNVGALGGDLTGSLPSPSVGSAKITAAKMSSGAATSGQAPLADGAGGVAYGAVGSPIRIVSLPFTPATAGLASGSLVVATLSATEVLSSFRVQNRTVWDGTQPQLLITANLGTIGTTAQEIDLTQSFASIGLRQGPAAQTANYFADSPTPIFLRSFSNQSDAITNVVQLTKTFTVAGDQTVRYPAGLTIAIFGSTGNNGTYTVASSSVVAGDTAVVVVEVVPDGTADGSLNFGGLFDTSVGASTIELEIIL